jgi:hypothetical protein
MIPKERVRFSGVVTSLMYAWATVRFPAVAPATKRPAKSIHRDWAPPRMAKPTSRPSWLASSTRLRPNRSERDPRSGPEKSCTAA